MWGQHFLCFYQIELWMFYLASTNTVSLFIKSKVFSTTKGVTRVSRSFLSHEDWGILQFQLLTKAWSQIALGEKKKKIVLTHSIQLVLWKGCHYTRSPLNKKGNSLCYLNTKPSRILSWLSFPASALTSHCMSGLRCSRTETCFAHRPVLCDPQEPCSCFPCSWRLSPPVGLAVSFRFLSLSLGILFSQESSLMNSLPSKSGNATAQGFQNLLCRTLLSPVNTLYYNHDCAYVSSQTRNSLIFLSPFPQHSAWYIVGT